MRKTRLLLGVFLAAIAGCKTSATPPAPKTVAAHPSASTSPSAVASTQDINDRFERQMAERIGDRKGAPAGDVFENVRIPWLKNVPAATLLDIMNFGYSRALGVTCLHCHREQDFASDDKRPKRAAREMAYMHHMINDQLRGMNNLEQAADKRSINCFTCHRGSIDPNQTPH